MEGDEQVYARVRAGERTAMVMLVERYYGPLLKFLTRMTGLPQTAEDLVQDTFIRVLRYRGVSPHCFRPWIYQIARNLARDTFRSAARHRETEYLPGEGQEDEQEADPFDTESLALQISTRQQVNALLQDLPASQREVVVLRFYQELSLKEISTITGAPLGTVKSRLFHGLRRARQILEQEEVRRDE